MSGTHYNKLLHSLCGSIIVSQCFGCPEHIKEHEWIHPPCRSSNRKMATNKKKSSSHSGPFFSTKKFGYRTKLSGNQCGTRTISPNYNKLIGIGRSSKSCSTNTSSCAATSDATMASPNSDSITQDSQQCTGIKKSKIRHNSNQKKILKMLFHDAKALEKLKSNNYTLKKKVLFLQMQLKNEKTDGHPFDIGIMEDLVKNYQDVLVKYMKLEVEKKALEETCNKKCASKDRGCHSKSAVQASTSAVQPVNVLNTGPDLYKKSGSAHQTMSTDPIGEDRQEVIQRNTIYYHKKTQTENFPDQCFDGQLIASNTHHPEENTTIPPKCVVFHDQETPSELKFGSVITGQHDSVDHNSPQPSSSSDDDTVYTRDIGLQCIITDVSEEAFHQIEKDLWTDYQSKVNEAKIIYDTVLNKYKEQLDSQEQVNADRELKWIQETKILKEKLAKQKDLANRLKFERKRKDPFNDEINNGSSNTIKEGTQSRMADAGTPLTLEHLEHLLEKWKHSSDASPQLLAARQTIEESMRKWYDLLQQQSAATDVAQLKSNNEALDKQNMALADQLRVQERAGQDLRYKVMESQLLITDLQKTCDQLQLKTEEASTDAQKSTTTHQSEMGNLQKTVDSMRQDLVNAQTKTSDLNFEKRSFEQELKQKDNMIDSLNTQTEDRIKENCSLNTRIEEQANELRKLTDNLQNRERELKILVAEYKQKIQDLQIKLREVTNLREDDRHQYEKQIRQLQLELDQLRVRNETFQRQLAAITSTYSLMFPPTDASDSSP